MAKLKNDVNKEELKADIEALKNAKTDEEVDAILAKYNDALNELEENKNSKAESKPKAKSTTKAQPKAAATKKASSKAKEEEPKAAKGRSYNGKYEVYEVADGYQYHLKASNGEILFQSEVYTSRDGVKKAIDALKRNIETGEIRVFADKRGNYKFKLISKNYRVLAISATYTVEKSAIRASESFKKFALKADIVDIELDDAELKSATPIEITTKENKPGGKFLVEKFNGEFSWDLKASNGQILCQAEGYTSRLGCMNSIDTFKKNIVEGSFKCVKDKTGKYMFKLYTPAGRICAVGESYATKQGAESAANSVVSFYKKATLDELKDES